jgi:hypothetical protein
VKLATSKLDQKSIENILVKIYEKSQKSASLKATDVIQDIVQQLKLVLEPSPSEKELCYSTFAREKKK